MKISKQYPPNYTHIISVFPNLSTSKPIFTYGDTLYNPFEIDVTPDLEVHEQVHTKQQSLTPEIWWKMYLENKDFRLTQELEAYGEQYKFILKHITQYKMKDWVLDNMASALSGELYGNLLTFGQARSKIRNYAKSVV